MFIWPRHRNLGAGPRAGPLFQKKRKTVKLTH